MKVNISKGHLVMKTQPRKMMFAGTSFFFCLFPSPIPVQSENARKKNEERDSIKSSTSAIFMGVGKF